MLVCAVAAALASGKPKPLPAVTGPVANGINLSVPEWAGSQPLVRVGAVDVTAPPFNADSSGVSDATAALQKAVDFARAAYLAVHVPSGVYRVSGTIDAVQPGKEFLSTVGTPNCNNMREVYGGKVGTHERCGRTAPAVIAGSLSGPKPVFTLAANTGLKGPVVKLTNPENENINMNQVFSGIDIRIEAGNSEAVGIYARGAQGTGVQNVTIHAGDAAVGLFGGAGSGGSHIGVTVIGGRVGMQVGSAQPGPTLTGVTLVNQTHTALLYDAPGRQTLSVVGLKVVAAAGATGPPIHSFNPLSVADSVVEGAGAVAVAAEEGCSLFLSNVWTRGYEALARLPNGTLVSAGSSEWARASTIAAPAVKLQQGAATPAYVDSERVAGAVVAVRGGGSGPGDLQTSHLPRPEVSWESGGVCMASEYGAKGDLETDDTASITAMLRDPKCNVCFLHKGYFSVKSTLDLACNQTLVGVSRMYTHIVPHPDVRRTVPAGEAAWPVVRTCSGVADETTVSKLSVVVWRHMNSSYALNWRAGRGTWDRAHTNRQDLYPGRYRMAVYSHPLSLMDGHGGGKFYNFYQENWDSQAASYRHLLVNNTDADWSCYHCNLEHSPPAPRERRTSRSAARPEL
eukprot:TRINITY_DN13864_c0_g1_i2.p1 TRINITY_DN13864_c0_g1~~TRINITY_DN13864_c0_g1_i2.p1  ORF type:complete len:626 (+),score=136.33 TRINITY_DN13864_c0_g1_i2:68-1945(+)